MGKDTVILSLILFNIFFIAFIGAIVIFIKQYKLKKSTHLKELETVDILHKEELLKTQTEIQKEIMQYIGREIHDNVGQKLTLSSIYLQQIVFENKAPQISKNINAVNTIINESLNELRHLSKSLTDDAIEYNSIIELLEIECKKINELKKYTIVFENSFKKKDLSYQIKSILLRITQEFIQNSIKHSKCKKINISLSNSQNELKLILKDNGKGFDTNKTNSQGIGLKNINKRIEILKGNSILQSNKNGTILTLKIPV
jgi:signal transduction histidine kinase